MGRLLHHGSEKLQWLLLFSREYNIGSREVRCEIIFTSQLLQEIRISSSRRRKMALQPNFLLCKLSYVWNTGAGWAWIKTADGAITIAVEKSQSITNTSLPLSAVLWKGRLPLKATSKASSFGCYFP